MKKCDGDGECCDCCHYGGCADTSSLESKLKAAREALDGIMHEIGIPQPGYPAPIANAYQIAKQALAAMEEV
jgi:hypothetical protein